MHVAKEMITFDLGDKCNLQCIYCYNENERCIAPPQQTLPLKIAKAGIDMYFAQNPSRHIRFYGPGEPTQQFDRMKEITEYAKSASDNVTMEIQTNGIFTDEVREWLLDNANIIWMSFDGPSDIQNHNRPLNPEFFADFGGRTSAEILEDNVRWLNQNKGDRDLMVGARVTMTYDNINRQREMIDYFSGLGIKYVWTNPLFYGVDQIPVCDDPEKQAGFQFNMDGYVDQYIDAFHYAKEKDVFWGSFLMINFDGESPCHCRACLPAPHLTPDGYLSACDMVTSGANPHHMAPLVYGKYNSETNAFDIYEDKVQALQERCSTNMKHCQNCPAKMHCGGSCLGEVVNESGDLLGRTLASRGVCNAVRRLWRELGPQESNEYLHP